ncbi:MAG: hypothetical protein JO210_10690 [Acidobacteriaceae bacterium]|nr:hypothetical protein [Acidobacteriaceae bacterium]
MAGLLSVFAEFEREVLRERILAGLHRHVKRHSPGAAADRHVRLTQNL